MKDFWVYFQIYGKKIKVKVPAFNKAGAEKIVRDELKIVKVTEIGGMEEIKDMFENMINSIK